MSSPFDAVGDAPDSGAAGPPLTKPAADPRLDFTSPAFDAALVLATEGLVPPVPDAPVLDNVAKWKQQQPEELLQQLAQHAQPGQQQQQQQQKREQSVLLQQQPQSEQQTDEGSEGDEEAEGEDAEEQQRRKQESRAKHEALKARAQRAVARAEAAVPESLSLQGIMNLVPTAEGPLSILHTWTAAQQRVCVVTRHAVGVRGRAIGTLRGFDRFMNLLLLDVVENYTVIIKVPRYKGQQPQEHQQHGQPPQQQQQQQAGGRGVRGALPAGSQQEHTSEAAAARGPGASVASEGARGPGSTSQGPGKVRVRWCRKQEHRFRKMDQVLVRGDSVVLLYAVQGSD